MCKASSPTIGELATHNAEENTMSTNNAVMQKKLRETWRKAGLESVTVYVPKGEGDLVKARALVKQGAHLLQMLPSFDEALTLAVAERKPPATPALSDVAEYALKLAGAEPKMRVKFDAFHQQLANLHALRGKIETLSYNTQEELIYANAEFVGHSMIVAGEWVQVQDWYKDL